MSPSVEIVRFTCGPFEENPYLVVGLSARKAMIATWQTWAEGIVAKEPTLAKAPAAK